MENVIKLIVLIVNTIHDFLFSITNSLGYKLTDKDLHFWVIGLIGIIIFISTQIIFKSIAKWSITAISFIYSFTVLLVIVFAIEIEQKITGRGVMEFEDIVVGLYGFLLLFFIYLIARMCVTLINKYFNRKRK